jgi:hypothetical protein
VAARAPSPPATRSGKETTVPGPARQRQRLFAEGTVPAALRLVESATFPQGAVHLTCERAGQPAFGSMA